MLAVRSSDRCELRTIAEQPVRRAPNGSRGLQRSQRSVDLWAAGAQQQPQFALGISKLEGNAPSGPGLSIADRQQEKSRQTNVERIERHVFEPVADIAKPRAQERDDNVGDGGALTAKAVKNIALQSVDRRSDQRGRFGAARQTVEHCDFTKQRARPDDFEAEFAT